MAGDRVAVLERKLRAGVGFERQGDLGKEPTHAAVGPLVEDPRLARDRRVPFVQNANLIGASEMSERERHAAAADGPAPTVASRLVDGERDPSSLHFAASASAGRGRMRAWLAEPVAHGVCRVAVERGREDPARRGERGPPGSAVEVLDVLLPRDRLTIPAKLDARPIRGQIREEAQGTPEDASAVVADRRVRVPVAQGPPARDCVLLHRLASPVEERTEGRIVDPDGRLAPSVGPAGAEGQPDAGIVGRLEDQLGPTPAAAWTSLLLRKGGLAHAARGQVDGVAAPVLHPQIPAIVGLRLQRGQLRHQHLTMTVVSQIHA